MDHLFQVGLLVSLGVFFILVPKDLTIGLGYFAVCPCTDPEVIAEGPVIEIVLAPIILLLGLYPFLDVLAGSSTVHDVEEEGKGHNVIVHLHGLLVPIVVICYTTKKLSLNTTSKIINVLSKTIYHIKKRFS